MLTNLIAFLPRPASAVKRSSKNNYIKPMLTASGRQKNFDLYKLIKRCAEPNYVCGRY